jgi:hypothetical protein
MEAIQGSIKMLSKILSGQGNASTDKTATPVSQQSGDSGFDATLKVFLGTDPAKKVSEEELFSALIQERIKKTKGDEALTQFQGLLSEAKTKLRKPDGFVPIEDATKEALKAFRDAGTIKAEEADSMYSQAFAAAQLDENKEVLFDDRGGPNDPTMAVAAMEQALLMSRAMVEKFDAGSEAAPVRSLSEMSTGKMLAGSGVVAGSGDTGFLFKPVSESDGKLVVLLPPRLSGLVKGLTLVGPNGEVLEQGRYTGNGNGGREHFRFSKPGAQYPDGLTVQATLASGELVRYIIRETSDRAEHVSSSGWGDDDQQSSSNKSSEQKSGQDNSSL